MKIAMIGAGQQGVSQGLAFAQLPGVREVIFYDTNLNAREILIKAQEAGVDEMKIHMVSTIEAAQEEADITAINVPMSAFEAVAYEAVRYAKRGNIMYDNGSGKTQAINDIQTGIVLASLEGHAKPVYVPAHFFVGRAGTGPQLADVKMYQGATAALIALDGNERAVQTLKTLFERIGVKNVRTDLSAQDHDQSLGFYSHHNTFFQGSLMCAFPETEIAGHTVDIGTFLGSTRVAETGKDGLSMWGPIAIDNAAAIAHAGSLVISKLEVLDTALDDPQMLTTLLGQAHDYVAAIPESRPAESLQGDLYDLRRQENPALEIAATDKVSDTLKPYIATHVAMPVVFAAASVLGAMAYESNGGQPFMSIGNSSFYGTMRPLRNSVEDMTASLQDNKQAVREALRHLSTTHQSLISAIENKNAPVTERCLSEAQNVRSRLPRERTADQIRHSFTLS